MPKTDLDVFPGFDAAAPLNTQSRMALGAIRVSLGASP